MVRTRVAYARRAWRRTKSFASRYGPQVATAVAQKYARSFTATATTSANAGGVVSGQRDTKTDYRKRRLTKRQRWRQRKRWRQTRYLINTIRNATIGTSHIVRRSLCNLATADNQSNWVGYGLYSLDGNTDDVYNTHNDIAEFFKEADPAGWSTIKDPTLDSANHKIHSHHGTAEFTIRNNNSTEAGAAIVEAYFIYGRKPLDKDFAISPADCFRDSFKKQSVIADPETGGSFEGALAATQIGVTPFQASLFCKHFKIYKRQKYLIPPGDEVSFVINDRRPRTFTMDQAKNFTTDRNYHGVLFQMQGVPAAGETPPKAAKATALTFMCVRRYRLKFVRDQRVMDSFETSA